MTNKESSDNNVSLYKKDFTVMVYDLDIRRSSGMPMICNWLQEAGLFHGLILARHIGFDVSDIVFVLTRLDVIMDRYPAWRETVTIESWLSPITDRFVRRNFLLHGTDGKIIGRAMNSAAPFSLSKRAGVAFTGDLNSHTIERESALPHDFKKIPVIEGEHTERNIQVRYFDCDLFYHVNNVKYIQWCIESIPLDYLKNHTLRELDINFRAEGNLDDTVTVKTVEDMKGNFFIHAITDSSGTKDLVRMTSRWE